MSLNRKIRLASLASNILNPFLVSFLAILLISLKTAPDLMDALRWTLLTAGMSITPILAIIVWLVHKGRLKNIFIDIRKERNKIYLLAALCISISSAILYWLGAPPVLLAASSAGLISVIVFMFINLKWKISVHTGFISGSVAVIIILYGVAGAPSIALVPLTGWARIVLKRHSPAQVTTGALLAALIAFLVFYTSGLLPASVQ